MSANPVYRWFHKHRKYFLSLRRFLVSGLLPTALSLESRIQAQNNQHRQYVVGRQEHWHQQPRQFFSLSPSAFHRPTIDRSFFQVPPTKLQCKSLRPSWLHSTSKFAHKTANAEAIGFHGFYHNSGKRRTQIMKSLSCSNKGMTFTTSSTQSTDGTGNVVGTNVDDCYSLTRLQQRMTEYVQKSSQEKGKKLVFAASGGGGHFLSTLSSTSGASSILLEGSNVYDRNSYRQYIHWNNNVVGNYSRHNRHRRHRINQSVNNIANANNSSNTDTKSFKYCSSEASMYLSEAALQRAVTLTAVNIAEQLSSCNFEPPALLQDLVTMPIGVGCTAALFTSSSTRTDRLSRAHIVVQTGKGISAAMDVVLVPSNETVDASTNFTAIKRTRFDEDVFVSHCILMCLEYIDDILYSNSDNNENNNHNYDQSIVDQIVEDRAKDIQKGMSKTQVKKIKTLYGDEIVITLSKNWNSETSTPVLATRNDIATEGDSCDSTISILEAAHRVLSGTDSCAVLVPVRRSTITNDENDSVVVNTSNTSNEWMYHQVPIPISPTTAITGAGMGVGILPPQSLIMPGSFNPAHAGHIALAMAASHALSPNTPIWFELSLTNADKPPLDPTSVVERLQSFFKLLQINPPQDGSPSTAAAATSLPPNWGVILTDAPLFVQKVNALAPLLAPSFLELDYEDTAPTSLPSRLNFCIGTDTLLRLVDPKYYSNSQQQMLNVLQSMPCHFVVGGRLEQIKTPTTTNDTTSTNLSKQQQQQQQGVPTPKFITGEEYLINLPNDIRSKFTLLPNFRVDTSSTELRKQQKPHQYQTN